MATRPSAALMPPHALLPGVEYLDFQDVSDCREYRLAVHRPDGRTECRFRIANAAFAAGRARLQDGPDICYQKLLREVTGGETQSAEVVTIDDVELASYREAHTPTPKHRMAPPPATPRAPHLPRMQLGRPPRPEPPVAAPPPEPAAPAFDEGQRVSHADFALGVVTSSDREHTTICFDENGPRTFITALLQLEVLSAPHTWVTGPRGRNRPR